MQVAFDVKLPSDRLGGVEKQFARFLHATAGDPRLRTYLFDRSIEERHGMVEQALQSLSEAPFDARRLGPLVVPKPLRLRRQAAFARSRKIDVVVNINRFGNLTAAHIAERSGARSVYWERGAAWFTQDEKGQKNFFEAFDLYLANSNASRAMLVERWGVRKPVEILAPAVWEVDLHQPQAPRALPAGRPLRLGFAGRLRGFKGGVLAVHTLRELIDRHGLDAELHIAGHGEDLERMDAQAKARGVEGSIHRYGTIADMTKFYETIDILLHPALREPYGNVAAEAQFYGVPVVTTWVDGLPEVVEDGRTGLCVEASGDMPGFTSLGGNAEDVYSLVYYPARTGGPKVGALGSPRFPEPEALADAVASIVATDETYRQYSANGIARALANFTPAVHIDRFVELMKPID